MQRNIIFLRHGKVELPYASHNEMPFSILNELGMQRLDPSSDISFIDSNIDYLKNLFAEFKFSYIFRSSSLRCATLEKHLRDILNGSDIPVRVFDELREIRFDLKELFASEDIRVEDIGPQLFKTLINGGPGVENYNQVLGRIKTVMNQIPTSGNVLILTHGYLMKVIAAIKGDTSAGKTLSLKAIDAIPRFFYFDGFKLGSNSSIEYFSANRGDSTLVVSLLDREY